MYAPEAMEAIEAYLDRNRQGLSEGPLNAETKSTGDTSPPMCLTLRSSTSPILKNAGSTSDEDGMSARQVLQLSDRENWVLCTGK